jgi:copper chaperone CopZ
MIRTTLFALGLFSGLAIVSSDAQACSASDAEAAAAGELPAKATVATFSVLGMTCGSCALKIKTAVEQIDGVSIAKVHMDGTMEVAYDASRTNIEAILSTANELEKFTVKRA